MSKTVHNLSSSHSKDKLQIATSFKERLDELGCPFTDSVDESWITELIFRPGEPRIRLLNWLFSKFDSKLADTLDPQYAPTDTKMDSRIQRLLFVASTLGLCRPDDADLIRGCSSSSKQVSFMNKLLNMVCVVDAAEDPQNKLMTSPGTVSNELSLEEQLTRDCAFLDKLASTERMESVFCSRAKLLPPDIMKQVQLGWDSKGCKDYSRPPVPDLALLTERTKTLEEDLARQNEILSELKAHIAYQDPEKQDQTTIQKTLKLVLSELSQLLVGFTYCYDNEMRQWCNRPPPKLNELGQAFKRVHNLLGQFSSLLDGIASLKTSHLALCTNTKSKAAELTKKNSLTAIALSCQEAATSFQDCIDILEESIHRKEGLQSLNSTLSSTLNTSTLLKF